MFVVARSPTNPALLHLPQDKGIGSIDIIRNYPHLQVVEMPGNSIKDISALSAQWWAGAVVLSSSCTRAPQAGALHVLCSSFRKVLGT